MMTTMMIEWIVTRHPLEAVACLLSIVAFVMTFWPLRNALADHATIVRQNTRGPIRLISTVNVIAEQSRMGIATVCVLATGAALNLEPDATFPQPVIYSLSFIMISLILGATILVERHTRYDIRWMDQATDPPRDQSSSSAA